MLSIPAALALYLQTYATPFDWEKAHCGDFIGGWVLAHTGRSPVRGMARHGSAVASASVLWGITSEVTGALRRC